MERYYRQTESNTGPYQRLSSVHHQNTYNSASIRLPYPVDNRMFLQQESTMTSSLPGSLYLQPNVNNFSSRIHEMATPDLPLYGPVRPVAHFPNNFVEYQEPNYEEYGQDYNNFPPPCAKKLKYNSAEDNRLHNIKLTNIQCAESTANNILQSGSGGEDKQRISGRNVHTRPDVVGHVPGRGGSTPEAAQTCSGSTSVIDISQSRGKQGKLSHHNTTHKESAENYLSSKDGNIVKDAHNKQKDKHASGMRIFTGSVEKVMKWHKSLSDTEVNTMYDVIARCVSLRSGKGCQKLLLLRDASGPVLQATYYEIDFLLPDVPPGSTIRVVGKMVGSNRMSAFKVREATPGEVASLPRLCAIGQHMVTKLLNVK